MDKSYLENEIAELRHERKVNPIEFFGLGLDKRLKKFEAYSAALNRPEGKWRLAYVATNQ